LKIGEAYYENLAREYAEKRDFLFSVLVEAGFKAFKPQGAYYIMTDVGHWGVTDDVAFAFRLIKEAKVATVPGSAFYNSPELGKSKVRFCFPKQMETLRKAAEGLRGFRNQ
jgi:aspartate/methionine/tyrosine aminotransferase